MGLDSVELVMRFEKEFGIAIPDEIVTDLTTPRKVTDYVFFQLTFNGQKGWTREKVARMVREIVIDETGVTNFTEDSRFVQDMGID
jgi:phosphopantetheine binding protein